MKTFYTFLIVSVFSLLSVTAMAQDKIEAPSQKPSAKPSGKETIEHLKVATTNDFYAPVYTEDEVKALGEEKTRVTNERLKKKDSKQTDKSAMSSQYVENQSVRTKEIRLPVATATIR